MAQDKEHWQVDKTLQQCNQHLLEHSQHYSDVTFHVHCKQHSSAAPVEIRALRMLLLARSPVFHAMFSGDWKEAKDDIYVDDIEPDAFREMLRFVYTDEVTLTTDNVTAVLYASKKYIITNLTKECLEFLKARLTPDTAAQIFEQSLIYEEQELKEKALHEIHHNPREVLSSEDFIQSSKATLHEILQLDALLIREIEVFQAAMKWAGNKCEQLEKAVNATNLRKALGEDFYSLRFPAMAIDEFCNIVHAHDVLTPAETLEIVCYIADKNPIQADVMMFSTKKRGPRAALAGPFEVKRGSLIRGSWRPEKLRIDTKLACKLSGRAHLTKLLVHGCEISAGLDHFLEVSVEQNNKRLFEYKGAHPTGPMASGAFPQYAIDVPGDSLVTGDLQLNIALSVSVKSTNMHGKYVIQTSPSATELKDQNICLTFPATADNLLLGIEYAL